MGSQGSKSAGLRWFTAREVARIDSRGELQLESSPYLGVDAQGRIAVRQPQRPEASRIIHDLGQVVLMPLGTRRCPLGLLEESSPSRLRGWLARQRKEGIGALLRPAQRHAPELLDQAQSLGLRVLEERESSQCSPKVPAWEQSYALASSAEPDSGTLTAGARFDATVLDLDHPHFIGLSAPQIHTEIRGCPFYPAVREMWIGGWRVML